MTWPSRRRRRAELRWQDTGEDDHFAGDPYVNRWLDERAPDDPDEGLWPLRRDVLSAEMDVPRWWRIWRWWR